MKNQKGMAVLMTTIILGAVMTMILMSGAQMGAMNYKIVSNTTRSAQADFAANAGLQYSINKLNQSLVDTEIGYDAKYKFTEDVPTISTATFESHAKRIDPDKDNLIKVTGYGFTDDNTSGRPNSVATALSTRVPVLAYTPLPIVGKNSIRMGFDAHVINHTGTLGTMWTGGTITFSNYIWDITNPDGTVNNDMGMYASDPNLVDITSDRFFENFFSVDKAYVKSLSSGAGIIWVDGDVDISTDMGTVNEPIIFIATGNVNFDVSGTDFYGVIYADSITVESGTRDVKIYGAIIAEDYINIDGETDIVFNTDVLTTLGGEHSNYVMVPGTWIDQE